MDKDIRDFVLKTLEREYGILVDDLRRAEQALKQERPEADLPYVQRKTAQVQTARQALAYFGVYR